MQEMKQQEQTPLKWPEGWDRTRIQDRKRNAAWKKSFTDYRQGVVRELERTCLGTERIGDVVISYNRAPEDRMDVGVAVYFSKVRREDYSWQDALGLLTPAPTLEQIDDAYRRLAMQHHPDRGGDIEIFKALTRHRDNARAWVTGTQRHEHEYVIACDRFAETRLNLCAIRLTLAAMRQIERVGASSILERTFRGFKTALPAGPSEGESK